MCYSARGRTEFSSYSVLPQTLFLTWKEEAKCSLLPLRFEFLHNIQEVIVDLWLATELQLHLVEIRQCILHLGTEQTGYISREDFISIPIALQNTRYLKTHYLKTEPGQGMKEQKIMSLVRVLPAPFE